MGLAVAAAAAILTGALLVGDSVRGSLRDLVLDRLGHVDHALMADRLFREQLADELSTRAEFSEHFDAAVPVMFLRGTIQGTNNERSARVGNVTIIGSPPQFWDLGSDGPEKAPQLDEIILNESLAGELGVRAGQEVIMRLPAVSEIPEDSPLGRTTDTIRSRRLSVSEIIPNRGLGRFSMSNDQRAVNNAFVPLPVTQDMLGKPSRVNSILVSSRPGDTVQDNTRAELLSQLLRPKLDDYGLVLERTERRYFNLYSEQMMLPDALVRAALNRWEDSGVQPTFTYLANSISIGERSVPYSTVTGIDPSSEPPLGPFIATDGSVIESIPDDTIVLNSWAAEQLDAETGDTVEVTYFEPESTHGEAKEHVPPERLKVASIVKLSGAAADPNLTPELPGVTDQASIDNWNPPFPFDSSRVRQVDEDYWDEYRATPKAFVSLSTARRMWASRFGNTTSIRIPDLPERTRGTLAQQLALDPREFGLRLRPVKQLSLAAAQGTTPFDILFLGFSFFIIGAAVMLILLLFRLGIDQRVAEVGVLAAVGFSFRTIRRIYLAESLVVATVGSLLGIGLGVGYAWLMLAGLRSWWLQAISSPFVTLHVTGTSLLMGFVGSICVSVIAIWFALRQLHSASIRSLLAAQPVASQPSGVRHSGRGRSVWMLPALLLLGAVIGGAGALSLGGDMQALAFFASGALVLSAGVAGISNWLKMPHRGPIGYDSLPGLATRSGARNPIRSVLTIGLVASATFLIISMSAFQLQPSPAGAGGYALMAESSQPIFEDLNSPGGRQALALLPEKEELLAGSRLVPMKVHAGDDASCLNLYQPTQPRVLGVAPHSIQATEADRSHEFSWAATAAETPAEKANPWLLLERTSDSSKDDSLVPVILDANTAMYSLHLWRGVGETYEIVDEQGNPLRLEVVALLKNSIFQGDLIIGRQAFLRHFPHVSGQRLFLIDTPAKHASTVASALEEALGDYGLDVQSTRDRLAEFMAVQNKYLETFQSLGALGLLMGTLGLATVQLRSVMERRKELALLRATGFRRGRLMQLVICENALLLAGGLLLGVLTSLVAVFPHLIEGRAIVPWGFLATTLTVILLFGLLSGMAAVTATVRAPLLSALRGD